MGPVPNDQNMATYANFCPQQTDKRYYGRLDKSGFFKIHRFGKPVHEMLRHDHIFRKSTIPSIHGSYTAQIGTEMAVACHAISTPPTGNGVVAYNMIPRSEIHDIPSYCLYDARPFMPDPHRVFDQSIADKTRLPTDNGEVGFADAGVFDLGKHVVRTDCRLRRINHREHAGTLCNVGLH